MKKYKILSLLLVTALLVSLLSGCGASAGGALKNETADMAAPEAPMEMAPEMDYGYAADEESSVGTSGTSTPAPANRKLIRTVYMDAQTKDMDSLLPAVEQQVAVLGGYMENREVYGGSSSTSQWRNAHLTIRIPADKADTFLGQVEQNANVTSLQESMEDITLDYVATASRITALETEQARLLELMEQAGSLTDLLEVEARLTDVVYELENYGSRLRLYDNLVDYATIHLSISQVTELTTPEDEQTVWERISTGFMHTLRGLGDTLVDILVWLIVASPVLAVLAIPVVIVVLIIRASRKKKAVKKAKLTPPPANGDSAE